MNWELAYVQAGFRKDRGTRDQIANIHWIIEKAREFQKNIYFCFIDYDKAFDCVGHSKLWKILKEMNVLTLGINKAGGGDGISAKLFQILKDDAVKVLQSICQQIFRT